MSYTTKYQVTIKIDGLKLDSFNYFKEKIKELLEEANSGNCDNASVNYEKRYEKELKNGNK